MNTAAEIQAAIGKLSRHEQFELAHRLAKSLGLRLYTDDGHDAASDEFPEIGRA